MPVVDFRSRSMLLIILLTFCSCFLRSSYAAFNLQNVFKPQRTTIIPSPISRYPANPILEVTDTHSNSRVHLIGVSHGAPASAKLVQDTIDRVKPAAIVLELCPDRYLSICLDAKIKPNGNTTLSAMYDSKIKKIEAMERNSTTPSYFMANLNFVKSQGFLVGTFIGMGLLVTGLQRVFRAPILKEASSSLFSSSSSSSSSSSKSSASNSNEKLDDEFVTAMRAAGENSTPIRLGDAPQEDTLRSVRQVMSLETFRLNNIVEGAKSLTFSSFGLPQGDYLLSELKELPQATRKSRIFATAEESDTLSALKQSQWINIPKVYMENTKMVTSLLPLLCIALLIPAITAALPLTPTAVSHIVDPSSLTGITSSLLAAQLPTIPVTNPLYQYASSYAATVTETSQATFGFDTIVNQIMVFLSKELSPEVEFTVDTVIDMVSVLLLIRLAKIIGSDRDRIIAAKIQKVCDEFPERDVVVVIGMLHCNGVARYLLSGKNPLMANQYA